MERTRCSAIPRPSAAPPWPADDLWPSRTRLGGTMAGGGLWRPPLGPPSAFWDLGRLPRCQWLLDPTVDPTRVDSRRRQWTVAVPLELVSDPRRPPWTPPFGSEKPGVGGSIPPLGTTQLISRTAKVGPLRSQNPAYYPNPYPYPAGTRRHSRRRSPTATRVGRGGPSPRGNCSWPSRGWLATPTPIPASPRTCPGMRWR